MPFENLSKVISLHEQGGDPLASLREPEQVLADHRRYGTGATCFALVYLFQYLLRRAGYEAELRTCDRYYGPDTHAAAVFVAGGLRWVFDPGYHVFQPLPLTGEAIYCTPPNPNASRVVRGGGDLYECYTGHRGNWRYRFLLKDRCISDPAFRQAWADSFRVDMMGYPVLNRFVDGRMIYLQKSSLMVRDLSNGAVQAFRSSELADLIEQHYGISRAFARRALALMGR